VLAKHGFKVYSVPEAEKLLAKGGSLGESYKGLIFYQKVRFLIYHMQMQMDLEDTFIELAHDEDSPCIILCDRGVMDTKAYVDQDQIWQGILDETGWTPVQLRDKRYEAVIHLVTAADGAL
jgi:hypothetical protein